ncbi:hypothetical protein DFQ28_001517 [Apophysomyces sp. BC1034]|nr:hypothetical protein DFQ28_001517 [Apophysomyces sp. BC1034]
MNMKRYRPPELPNSFFGWIIPLIKIDQEELLDKVGLDAVVMLEFIVMAIKFFSICAVFGLIILIPISVSTGISEKLYIDRISITVIQDSSSYLVAYLVLTYFFCFILFVLLYQTFRTYIYLRARYLINLSKTLSCRSVVVTGIPTALRSDQALAEYYENLGLGPVESTHVVRHIHRLNHTLKKRASALRHLEEAYARYWGNPCRIPHYDPDRILEDVHLFHQIDQYVESQQSKTNSTFLAGLTAQHAQKSIFRRPQARTGFLGLWGPKVDAIEYYTKTFDELDKQATEARNSPGFEMTNVGFVTFENMPSAIIAAQIAIHPEPFNCRTIMAYEPRDVIWKNISIRGRERIVRDVLIWAITVALVFFWVVPITFISSLTSIDTIQRVAPGVAALLEKSELLQNLIQSFLPTLLVNLSMVTLPLLFDVLGPIQGLRARSKVAASTFSKMPLNLLLLGALIVRGVGNALCKTPRDYAENQSPSAFNYGMEFPSLLIVFIIVLEYSTISPLILVFGTIYFCITYVVYKYQLLYGNQKLVGYRSITHAFSAVYFRQYESSGALWTMAFPRIIAGVIVFQLTMAGIFVLKNFYTLGALCIPLIGLTIVFKFTMDAAFKENSDSLSMQLLRDNINQLPTHNTTKEKVTDASDSPESKTKKRWKAAAASALRQRTSSGNIDQTLARSPTRRKIALDEDDYEAAPDTNTDYRQPPMTLNHGVLDTGLKRYGNPAFVGVLPQLWLPVKYTTPGEQQKRPAKLRSNDRENSGSHIALELAQLLRRAEDAAKRHHPLKQIQQSALEGAKAATGVSRSMFGWLLKRRKSTAQPEQAINQSGVSVSQERILDGYEEIPRSTGTSPDTAVGDDADSLDNDDGDGLHITYYHHPERRYSSATVDLAPATQSPTHVPGRANSS